MVYYPHTFQVNRVGVKYSLGNPQIGRRYILYRYEDDAGNRFGGRGSRCGEATVRRTDLLSGFVRRAWVTTLYGKLYVADICEHLAHRNEQIASLLPPYFGLSL